MAYPAYVTRELEVSATMQIGNRGGDVRKIQEWLGLNGAATTVDGDFGSATDAAVKVFQKKTGIAVTGKVNTATWEALIAPLTRALAAPVSSANMTLPAMTLAVAKQHLAQHPMEVGGDNRGPWVRIYMNGEQGPEQYWCAGFVTFVLRQACNALGVPMPIAGSSSCDSLAYQAKERGLFVPGSAIASGSVSWSSLGSPHIFLVRRTATDWTHTGFGHSGQDDVVKTIEGNTNDDGSRNGYEVCARTRSIQGKDFIRLPL